MEERCSFRPEELRALLVEVKSFREAGRPDDFVEVKGHAMAIAEALGWRRLRAELANIQGRNRLLQWRLEEAGRLFEDSARLWAEEDVQPRWVVASSTWPKCTTNVGRRRVRKRLWRTAEALARARIRTVRHGMLRRCGRLSWDLAEQLDRSLIEQNTYQSLLRELLERNVTARVSSCRKSSWNCSKRPGRPVIEKTNRLPARTR